MVVRKFADRALNRQENENLADSFIITGQKSSLVNKSVVRWTIIFGVWSGGQSELQN